MTTCAIYIRVSTEDQVKQYSPAAQLADLRAHAKKSGYRLPKEFEFRDDGVSGASLDRPALTAMRDQIQKGGIDIVLIADPDRLARKLSLQMVLFEEIERAGTRVEFLTTPMEATPEGRMFFHMKGVFSEYEREKIRARTTSGRKTKAKAGFIVGGRAPFGYRYIGKAQGERGRYVLDEEEAAIVRRIFQWMLEGVSTREITVRLNQQGMSKRGRGWAKSSLRMLLSNPVYSGRAVFNMRERHKTTMRLRPPDQWISIAVPPIITEKTFIAALERMRHNAERMRGRNTVNVYLLRGLVRCGLCGARLAGCPSNNHRYYRCIHRDRLSQQYCRGGLVHADKLEAFTWTAVMRCLKQPDILLAKLREFYRGLESERQSLASTVESLRRRLAQAEREEMRLLDEHVRDVFDPKIVSLKAEQLRHRRQDLEKELRSAEHRMQLAAQVSGRDKQIEELYQWAIQSDVVNPSRRQQILQTLLDEVRIRGRQVEIRGVLPGSALKPAASAVVKRTYRARDTSHLQPLAFVLTGSLDDSEEVSLSIQTR